MPRSSTGMRPLHIPLTQIQPAHAAARRNQAEGMVDGLGDPEPLFGQGEPLRERPAFGVAVAQIGPGGCGDDAIGAKAVRAQLTLERSPHSIPDSRQPVHSLRYRHRPDPG